MRLQPVVLAVSTALLFAATFCITTEAKASVTKSTEVKRSLDVSSATPDAPSTPIDVPSATTDVPSATTDVPSSTTDVPSATTDIPSTTSDVPIATPDCRGSSADLRHWATLELRGLPVFVHQRLDRKGHFLIEPLISLPDKAATLNASCVRLDRLTRRFYVSFPVTLQDDEVLYQAKELLKHVAPMSVTFMKLVSSELAFEHLPGGWWLEKFRANSEGRLGYLRINCPDHKSCVELRSQLTRHNVGIFERVFVRINATSEDGCVTLGNLTKQLTVPHSSQLEVVSFARTKRPRNCTHRAAPEFFREIHASGHQAFVTREGEDFWLEPLLLFQGAANVFRNASGWPGLSLRLELRNSTLRNILAARLRLLGSGALRFLHLVDYRMSRSGLAELEVEPLRLSADRATAYLRLMAPNATEAGAAAIKELSRQIAANPTLLFDSLRFNFSFSADDACRSAYWAERRVATPFASQYRIRELQRRHLSRGACHLAKQPQLEKVTRHRNLSVLVWRRLDRPHSAGRHFLIEPLMLYEHQLAVQFDYTRGAHFVGLNVTVQSPQVLEEVKRNLTYLPARSVAFMLIREFRLNPPLLKLSGLASVEFFLSYDQRAGYLRLYCDNQTACAGLKNYLQLSELLLERLHWNMTVATPDDACVAPEAITKLIATPSDMFDLAYLREKSPSRLHCADAAFPQVQAPLQPLGSCQLVAQRSLSRLAGSRTNHFLEPAFCFLGADRQFDYVVGRSFLRLRLGLTNASLIPLLRQALGASEEDTVDFMELWSLRVTNGTRLPGLEAGAFKASFDRSEAELRLYCGSAEACWKLHSNLQDNNTVLLENFNLELTASLPSYDCWMPRPMRKQIGRPNSTYFDLSYLNSKTHQLPGCPEELPITLFALKVVDGCPTFVYKREDAKAGFYVEPQFCFNGRVQYGYNYLTSSHYVSFGVDLNRPSTLASVAAQLADLAPKRVAFLEMRKVIRLSMNLSSLSRPHPDYLLDGFHITVDRRQGEFRVLCSNMTACRQLGSNVTARPWILFERMKLESLMADGVNCELSTSTHQQPSSSSPSLLSTPGNADFHLPLDILRLKLPTVSACKSLEAPKLFQILTVDGCQVVVYRMPPHEKSDTADLQQQQQQLDLVIEPLLCFQGNANNATVKSRDYLAGEDYVSIRLLLQSHSLLKAVQDQLSLTASSGSLKFAQLWDLRVTEEAAFDSLRVARVGISPDRTTAELRVACQGQMCDALVQTLAEEPADYLKSILLSVTSLVPSGKCHFTAPVSKRPLTIGYSKSSQCALDILTTTVPPTTLPPFQQWLYRTCNRHHWSNCILDSSGAAAYFFSRSSSTWESARSICRRLNGDLATIDSGIENDLVFRHLNSESWIGLHTVTSYTYRYDHYYGQRQEAVHRLEWVGAQDAGYRMFRSDYRSSHYDASYGCVAMCAGAPAPDYTSGVWVKKYCHESLRFVCKVRESSAAL